MLDDECELVNGWSIESNNITNNNNKLRFDIKREKRVVVFKNVIKNVVETFSTSVNEKQKRKKKPSLRR